MKVGFSLSRCVRDIIDKKVTADEVVILITRTNFDFENSQHWDYVFEGYCLQKIWCEKDHDEIYSIVDRLWSEGKIHQPRQYGKQPSRPVDHWMDLHYTSYRDPEIQEAYSRYQTIRFLKQNA